MEVLYPSNLALLSMFLKHPHQTGAAADTILDLKKEDPGQKTGEI